MSCINKIRDLQLYPGDSKGRLNYRILLEILKGPLAAKIDLNMWFAVSILYVEHFVTEQKSETKDLIYLSGSVGSQKEGT